jgi:PIN domain nuclease of toxin-antitoxin system
MRVLLDTHILLWWLAADPALPRRAAEVISDADTTVVVSAATAWEIAIKKAVGRLEAPDDLLDALEANDFESIAITRFMPWRQASSHSITATHSTGCSSLKPGSKDSPSSASTDVSLTTTLNSFRWSSYLALPLCRSRTVSTSSEACQAGTPPGFLTRAATCRSTGAMSH